jgi:hypothetical protein
MRDDDDGFERRDLLVVLELLSAFVVFRTVAGDLDQDARIDDVGLPVGVTFRRTAAGGAAWGEARPNSLRPRGAARAAPTRKN